MSPEPGSIESIEIAPFDAREASDTTLRKLHRVLVGAELDVNPGEPPTQFEFMAARLRSPKAPDRDESRYLATSGDDLVGYAVSAVYQDQKGSGSVNLAVSSEFGGRGIGATLLRRCLDHIEGAGRNAFIIEAPDGSRFEPALRRLGLNDVFRERISRLDVADLDLDLMQQWIDRATERAQEYELLFFDDRVPDEHLEAWCVTEESMNTAPLEGLELDDDTMTPERWRAAEGRLIASGLRFRGVLAIHRPTGAPVGLTTLFALDHDPSRAEQDDTVADPAHRNRGLGRWLKAANITRFVGEFPDVERIYTGNAASNEPMLAINDAMGFYPAVVFTAWQGSIAQARSHLDS